MDPIIIGIDPGTTLGYAVLDVEGNLIDIGSSKLLDRDKLIAHLSSLGSAIVVGCDKKRTPQFVDSVGKRLGARIISPETDILVKEKRDLIRGMHVDDDHQRDALASAIYAYKAISSLLRKIRIFIRRHGLEEISSRLYTTVVREGVSIQYAHGLIENPEKEEVRIVQEAVRRSTYTKEGYLRLYGRITDQAARILRLKGMLSQKNKRLKEIESDLRSSKRAAVKSRKAERKDTLIASKDRKINGLAAKQDELASENRALKKELKDLNKGIMRIDESYVLKSIPNLGKGFDEVNRVLDVCQGDMLLVDDPSVWSETVVAALSKKVDVLVSRRRFPARIRESFITIDANPLKLKEFKYFSLVSRNALDKVKNKTALIEKIVDDHRKRHLR